MKKALLSICLLIITGICSFGQIKFNFIYDEFDFGVAEEGVNLTCTFEFTNDGTETIYFKEETRDVRPGCGCTSSEYSKDSILPGGKGFIKAGYNTQGRLGAFTKNITVSQKNTPYKILTIKGVVIKKAEETKGLLPASKKAPLLSLDKKGHDFGKLEKNKSGLVKLTLKNAGKDTLKITSSYSACNCITYKLKNPKDNVEQQYVLAGKTVTLEVSYTPALLMGLCDSKTKDVLTLFTNDPKNPKIELTLQSEIVDVLQK